MVLRSGGCLIAVCALLLPAFLSAALNPVPELRPAGGETRVCVDETSTRVMVARVMLTVGDLVLDNGAQVGDYSIEVPMRSNKNESGSLYLKLEEDFRAYMHQGGVLHGIGRSYTFDGQIREILCEVIPSGEDPVRGRLRLEINTGNRVMEFDTAYEVRGEIP